MNSIPQLRAIMLTAPISKALINRTTVSEKREPDSGQHRCTGLQLGLFVIEKCRTGAARAGKNLYDAL
jgi:hypothetical protein